MITPSENLGLELLLALNGTFQVIASVYNGALKPFVVESDFYASLGHPCCRFGNAGAESLHRNGLRERCKRKGLHP